jgi:type IV pilus assembly protein PilN
MIRINLLPFRAARKKENIRRQVSIFLLSLSLVSVALVYYNISLGSKIKNLNNNIKETKKQVATYNKINQEIKEIKKKLGVLKKKTEVIKNLELNRKEPVRLLDTMTNVIIPKRMWLTDFQSKGKTVEIKGIALDNKTVADFMTRLEGAKLFSSVNLKTLQRKSLKGKKLNLKSFKISCKKVSANKGKKKKSAKGKAKK